MNHHLILILTEVLDWVALTRLEFKGRDYELLEKFIFQYALGERGVGCIGGDGSESIVMRHPHFFGSLLHKIVEILETDELFGLSPRVVMLIPRVGM